MKIMNAQEAYKRSIENSQNFDWNNIIMKDILNEIEAAILMGDFQCTLEIGRAIHLRNVIDFLIDEGYSVRDLRTPNSDRIFISISWKK